MSTPTGPHDGPAPVLQTRTTEQRGLWLPLPDAVNPARTWIPDHVLADLDTARTQDIWTQTDTLTQEDALVAAGLAERDRDTSSLRGTPQLAALLHPTLDEHGGHAYDPAVHGPFRPGDPGTEPLDAEAEQAGYLRCFGCGTLPVRYSRLRYHDNELAIDYDNALLITVRGGYALFFDDTARELVACHDCAHQLCDTFPALAAVLTPATSHAHPDRYKAEHPDHVGWDTSPAGPFDPDHLAALRANTPTPDPRISRPADHHPTRRRGLRGR